jgi:prepilin signal peptidase PulO-like enzyme (type II secretory pathway)
MEIDNWLSLGLMLFLLLINILLYFNTDIEVGLIISDNFSYIPYNNLYAALLLGLPFFLTVLITKEKALGSGDIRIALISGFLIGRTNIMVWLYITIFSALIYGLILGYKKKSIKNLKIPFAPFMILGTVLSLLLDMYI